MMSLLADVCVKYWFPNLSGGRGSVRAEHPSPPAKRLKMSCWTKWSISV